MSRLVVQTGEMPVELLARQAGRQNRVQGIEAGVVVGQQLGVAVPVELRPGQGGQNRKLGMGDLLFTDVVAEPLGSRPPSSPDRPGTHPR